MQLIISLKVGWVGISLPVITTRQLEIWGIQSNPGMISVTLLPKSIYKSYTSSSNLPGATTLSYSTNSEAYTANPHTCAKSTTKANTTRYLAHTSVDPHPNTRRPCSKPAPQRQGKLLLHNTQKRSLSPDTRHRSLQKTSLKFGNWQRLWERSTGR